MTDLLVVVPDKDTEQALTGLFPRHQSLGIRPIACRVLVHPHKDPGCYGTAHELAAGFASEYAHALVVFDAAWEGAPSQDPMELASTVDQRLEPLWQDRARCVVIDPELENWVWSDSPHVAEILGWRDRQPQLRQWLIEHKFWAVGHSKPADPERAFRAALREVRLPPSASVFRQLAERVGVSRCQDPAFLRLLAVLRAWFAPIQAE